MRKNTYSHPKNWCVVNVQLDGEYAEKIHFIQKTTGLTMSHILKKIIYPELDRMEAEIKDAIFKALNKKDGEGRE